MIIDRPLTADERRFSQYTLRNYWVLSALALACCGDAVLPLLGVVLHLPDGVLSMLGAMNYASFLLLPLGFIIGGKLGAGKCMALNNLFMALAALLLMSAVWLGKWMFFAGLILFLTARAANYSMRFTLQKHIATAGEMPAMLARNYIGMHSASLVGYLAVSLIFRLCPGAWTLPGVLAVSILFFAAVAWCINRIIEPQQVRELAAEPLTGQIKAAWGSPLVRHQIYVGTLLNLFLAAVVPVNIIAAKRGAGISDAMTVLLIALQAVSSIGGSVLVKEITRRFGARKMMLCGYPLAWALCGSWCLLPIGQYWWMMFIPFVLGGVVLMAFGTSLENYFIASVPGKLQLGGTFLVFVITGGMAGVLGMILNWGIFQLSEFWQWSGNSMMPFCFYFMSVGVLFAPGILAVASLPSDLDKKVNNNTVR